MKIVRLTGGFNVICSDEQFQEELDLFLENVPVGLTGKSLGILLTTISTVCSHMAARWVKL
ncbi:MAG: hypothetical protein LUG26_00560 [Ruminococcus sp.]|nr:hypothetical protein [Ruminococcus sp.]